ncbi:hypothetical protein Taro_010023 [Colocasia esculenta]|uniref:Uncharacterized protein n=1 Tax=Colocasia esculenta TaxID=4460 RepID=A0A843U1W5_COLES|nr:hypothetical protein [Colocasia esculenta]
MFQVIEAFNNSEFFNSTFPLLFEICNESMMFKDGNVSTIPASQSAVGEDKSEEDASIPLDKFMNSVAPKIVECLSIIKISQVHVAASECLLKMIDLYKVSTSVYTDVPFRDDLVHLCEEFVARR